MGPGLSRRGQQLLIHREWRSRRVLIPREEHPFGVRVRFFHWFLWISGPPGRMGPGSHGVLPCVNGTGHYYPYWAPVPAFSSMLPNPPLLLGNRDGGKSKKKIKNNLRSLRRSTLGRPSLRVWAFSAPLRPRFLSAFDHAARQRTS